ncbi:MAG: hypothetical protein J6M18_02540 [Actinomycetaceae bacterium]|nr:hypothetical protein [Actinomycetaceae bacterium]
MNDGKGEIEYLKLWEIDGDFLYATDSRGAIVHVDMNTGILTCMSENIEPVDFEKSYRYEISEYAKDGKVYQLIFDSEREEKAYVRTLDLKSGQQLERVDIPRLYDVMPGNLVLGSISINPRM